MTEECLECKYCEIIEYGACGFIGETVVKCRVCEENTEDKTRCWEAAKENYMIDERLKPCRYCKKNSAVMERWSSGGAMYMVRCNNPDCPVPPDSYPKGRKLEIVIKEWNER